MACRARLVVVVLALLVLILGLLGAASFSVYHHVPINVTIAMASAAATDDDQLYNSTLSSVISAGELAYETETVSRECTAASNETDCSTALINTGYCGVNHVILSETFLQYYLVVHSLIYPFCLLVVLLLYGLIYRAVLVQRARRRTMRSPAIALQQTASPPPLTKHTAGYYYGCY